MKIKIVFLINTIAKHGPGNVVINIIKGLDKEKYDISIITIFNGNDKKIISKLKQDGICVVELELKNKFNFILFGKIQLKKILKQNNYDIIHSHGIVPDCFVANCKLPSKKVSTIHCNIYEDYSSGYNKIISHLMIKEHIKALNKMDMNICCSKSVFDSMSEKIKNIQFVINGIDIEKEKNKKITRKQLMIPDDACVFIYVGVLSKRKNIISLVENFKKNHKPNQYLLVIGNGENFEECKKHSDNNIKMLGYQSNPIQYYSIADVYTSASLSEGMSMSIIEALASGLHLFLSNIPSHKEIFTLDEKMYLGEIFTEENFKQKINSLSKKLDKNNKENIKSFQKKYLSSRSMASKYDNLYEIVR